MNRTAHGKEVTAQFQASELTTGELVLELERIAHEQGALEAFGTAAVVKEAARRLAEG